MTDLELKELVANLGVRQADSEQRMDRAERYLEQAGRDLAESAERHKEVEHLQKENAQQIKETSLELAALGRETDRQIKETGLELAALGREADRRLKELGRQIGGLGQKFGGFTEGMAFPSMQRILEERFQMTNISAYQRSRRNGRTMEIDVLAYANTNVNAVYVVEVKSTLREEGLEQILRILREFHDFFPAHRGKKLYGILAAVNVSDEMRDRVLRAGIYLALIHDESFELVVPDDFQPRAF